MREGIRKYFFNESFFENIDNEKKAYWLGFIMADGNISSTNKFTKSLRLRINLHEKDIKMLERLKEDLEANVNIKHFISKGSNGYNDSPQVKIEFNSNKLCNDLINLGVKINKTYNHEYPKVKNNLIQHYIRGYFDGDGSIYYSQKERARYSFEIVAKNKEILEYFQKNLKKNNIKTHIYCREKNNTFRLITSSKEEINKIHAYMYNNSTIYMDRKYNIFCDVAV